AFHSSFRRAGSFVFSTASAAPPSAISSAHRNVKRTGSTLTRSGHSGWTWRRCCNERSTERSTEDYRRPADRCPPNAARHPAFRVFNSNLGAIIGIFGSPTSVWRSLLIRTAVRFIALIVVALSLSASYRPETDISYDLGVDPDDSSK